MLTARILRMGNNKVFSLHKFGRRHLSLIVKNAGYAHIGPKTNRCFSVNSTSNNHSKKLPILIGISAVGGLAVYVYSLLYKKPTPTAISDIEEEEPQPFINEHLQEDLEILREFGPIPYLLIGAGSASFTAFRAIRTRDPTAKVLMIGNETFYPYMRPPLSKEMWFDEKTDGAKTLSFTQWNGKQRSLFYEPEEYYFSIKDLIKSKNGGISIIRGKEVVKIDPDDQAVYLDQGEKITFEKCLIATGSQPKNLPVFQSADEAVKKHISVFRTLSDFCKLDALSKRVKSFVIIGGGFLGSELACGLVKRGSVTGLEVTQVFPESGNMSKVLPEYLSKWITMKLLNQGVKIVPNATVKSVSEKNNKIELRLSNDQVIVTDHVVVAIGVQPNTEIAKASQLETHKTLGGFLVNAEFEARKNIWVAGDASCFYDMKLGRRRLEHHDHAIVSGRLAGENMAGGGKPLSHQSMFWSDLGPDIGYEAIGIVDSSLPTVGIFTKTTETDIPKSDLSATDKNINSNTEQPEKVLPNAKQNILKSSDCYDKGVIFYLRENIIVGILLWNVFSKMSIARKIINESKPYDDLTEVARLFELHSSEL